MPEQTAQPTARVAELAPTGTDCADSPPSPIATLTAPAQPGCDLISNAVLQLLGSFEAKLFQVRRPRDAKLMRVLAVSAQDATKIVEQTDEPPRIVVFPGCTVPTPRQRRTDDAGQSDDQASPILPAQERQIRAILSAIARQVADSTTYQRDYRDLRKHLGAALLKVIPEHCKLLLEASASAVANGKGQARKEAAAIRKESRDALARELADARLKLGSLKGEIAAETMAIRAESRSALNDELRRARSALTKLNRAIADESLPKVNAYCSEHRFPPVPAPQVIAGRVCEALPATSGIYFVWSAGSVVYVGQSINLSNRCRLGHHAIRAGEMLSWVEIPAAGLDFAEWFYMGVFKPERNGRSPSQRQSTSERIGEK